VYRQSFHSWLLRTLPPDTFSGTHFCYSLSKPQGLVRLEGLGTLKKIELLLIGVRTRDLAAYSTAHQPSTLPRIVERIVSVV
jgi:hypothetical protein